MCHELHRLSWTAMNCVCLPVQPLLLDPTQNKRSTKNTHESPAVKIVPRTCKTYKNQWHKLCQETELVKNFKICKRTFLSNSEEEVPSLVCCWDRREDSRTRTRWQSHRKTQRHEDIARRTCRVYTLSQLQPWPQRKIQWIPVMRICDVMKIVKRTWKCSNFFHWLSERNANEQPW